MFNINKITGKTRKHHFSETEQQFERSLNERKKTFQKFWGCNEALELWMEWALIVFRSFSTD